MSTQSTLKTITEFFAPVIQAGLKIQQQLQAEQKPPEELKLKLEEGLKLADPKSGYLVDAMAVVGTRLDNLKRVVVYAMPEGSEQEPSAEASAPGKDKKQVVFKLPAGIKQVGQVGLLVEYYPSLNKPEKRGKPDGGSRGKSDFRSGREGQGKSDRRPKGPRQNPEASGGPGVVGDAKGGFDRARRPSRGRAERAPGGIILPVSAAGGSGSSVSAIDGKWVDVRSGKPGLNLDGALRPSGRLGAPGKRSQGTPKPRQTIILPVNRSAVGDSGAQGAKPDPSSAAQKAPAPKREPSPFGASIVIKAPRPKPVVSEEGKASESAVIVPGTAVVLHEGSLGHEPVAVPASSDTAEKADGLKSESEGESQA